MLLRQSKRLNMVAAISVNDQNSGEIVRYYTVSYEPNTVNTLPHHPSQRSRVESIQECAGDGACKPETRFSWYNGARGFSPSATTEELGPKSKEAIIFPMDVDRDGLDDLLVPDHVPVKACDETITEGMEGNQCAWQEKCFQGGCARRCRETAPHCAPGVECNYQGYCVPQDGFNPSYDPKKLRVDMAQKHNTVYWTNGGFNLMTDQSKGNEFNYLNGGIPELLPIDYNGDKIPDLLFRNAWSNYNPDTGNAYHQVSLGPDFTTLAFVTSLERPGNNQGNPELHGKTHLVDLDGNGFADVLQCWGPPSTDQPSHWTYRLHSGLPSTTGGSFLPPVLIPGLTARCRNLSFSFDLNGDGVSEYLVYPDHSDLNQHIRALRLKVEEPLVTQGQPGLTFVPEVVDTGLVFENRRDLPLVADVNGDGLKDLVFTTGPSPGGSPAGNPADSPKLPLLLRVNLGTGQFSEYEQSVQNYPAVLSMGLVVDYNGDGRDDILVPEILPTLNADDSTDPKGTWRVYLAHGTYMVEEPTGIPFEGRTPIVDPAAFALQYMITGDTRSIYQSYRGADLNGDGVPDLVGVDRFGMNIHRHSTLYEEDALKSIDDGLRYDDWGTPGHVPTVDISYAHLVDGNGTYTKGTGSDCADPDVDCVAGPKRVVKSYQLSNGLGMRGESQDASRNQFVLHYKDARYARKSRQWLGFAEKTTSQGRVLQVAEELREDKTYRIQTEFFDNSTKVNDTFPMAGRLLKRITVARGQADNYQSPHTFHEDSWRYETHASWLPPGFVGQGPFFIYNRMHMLFAGSADPFSPLSTDDSVMVPTIHTQTYELAEAVDEFANVLEMKAVRPHEYGSDTVKTTEIIPDNDTASWLIQRPSHITYSERSSPFDEADGALTTDMTYNSWGQVETITIDDSIPSQRLETILERDSFGNVVEVRKNSLAESRVSWVFYDTEGWYPYARQNSLGHIAYEHYDRGLGKLTQTRDPNGVEFQTTYDYFGRPVRAIGPDGVEQHIRRRRELDAGSQNWVSSVRQWSPQLGNDVTEVFNSNGQVLSSTVLGPQGDSAYPQYYFQAYAYDGLGEHAAAQTQPEADLANYSNPYSTALDGQGAHTYARDFAGHVLRETEPNGRTVNHDYLLDSRHIRTDDDGTASSELFGVSGELVQTEDPNGGLTTYNYGSFGSMKIVAPGDSVQGSTTLLHDPRGRLVRRTDPDRGVAFYQYNAFDELESETHGSPAVYTILYIRDELGRIERKNVQHNNGDSEGTGWRWDQTLHGIGKVSSMENSDGQGESYEYDSLGRLHKVHTTPALPGATGTSPTFTTTYNYSSGRLFSVEYPHDTSEPALVVYPQYGSAGLVTSVYASVGSASSSQLIWEWTGADARGRLSSERTGDNLHTLYEHNFLNSDLERISTRPMGSTTPIQDFEYRYNTKHLLTSQTDVNGQVERFFYDRLDRLSMSQLAGPSYTHFSYEDNGNVRAIWNDTNPDQSAPVPSGMDWSYDGAQPHAVTRALRDGMSSTFAYDALGRQTGRAVNGTTKEVSYKSFNKPSLISPNGQSSDPDATRFLYDGNESRIIKDSSKKQTLYIQGLYERTTNKLTGHTTVQQHISNGSRVVATVVSTKGLFDPSWSSTINYVHPDRLGSPTLITSYDQTNAVHVVNEKRSYDAFGRRRSESNWSQPPGPLLTRLTSGYTGHEDDDELGLVNMQGRIYDAHIARFLTPDPFVQAPTFSQSWNRYSYVFNTPTFFVDPSGFQGCDPNSSCVETEGVVEVTVTYSGPPILYTPVDSPAPSPEQVPGNQNSPLGSSATPSATGGNGSFNTGLKFDLDQGLSRFMGMGTGMGEALIPGGVAYKPPSGALNQDVQLGRVAGQIAGGLISIGTGLGGMGGGGALCLTGVGCLGGAPAMVASGYLVLNGAASIAKAGDTFKDAMSAPLLMASSKPAYLPSWQKVTVNKKHILDRHVPGAPYAEGRTVFPSTMGEKGIMAAIKDAYNSSVKVNVQGPRLTLQGEGAGLKIEIWFNQETNTIETAYPKYDTGKKLQSTRNVFLTIVFRTSRSMSNHLAFIVEPDSLVDRSIGPATGSIWLDFGGRPFPRAGWNDFVVPILAAFVSALNLLIGKKSEHEEVWFMDGPYQVVIKRYSRSKLLVVALQDRQHRYVSLEIEERNLAAALIDASAIVVQTCRSRGYWTSDHARLERGLWLLRKKNAARSSSKHRRVSLCSGPARPCSGRSKLSDWSRRRGVSSTYSCAFLAALLLNITSRAASTGREGLVAVTCAALSKATNGRR